MQRKDLIVALLAQPKVIRDAEEALILAQWKQQEAKDKLQDHEAHLILSGEITGKNQAERDAAMREHTMTAQCDLREAEHQTAKARVTLAHEQNHFSALRAVAGLLGPEPLTPF